MALRIAALYVETGGAYFNLEGVDPWDIGRDARLYAGPYPVIAHPPCAKWSPLAYINRRRIPGYEIGDDGGCFEAALAAVERWGGVLEHPAGSLAWKRFQLDRPERGFWKGLFGSWVTEVDQGRYGHPARKRTWLYVVGGNVPPPLDWTPSESNSIISGFTHQPKGKHVADEHRRIRPLIASRTPAAFRDVLIEIASRAGGCMLQPKVTDDPRFQAFMRERERIYYGKPNSLGFVPAYRCSMCGVGAPDPHLRDCPNDPKSKRNEVGP